MVAIKERNRLVLNLRPLVKMVAKSLVQGGVPEGELDDLTQEGIIGLIDAIERYDETRDVNLKSFCEYRVRGAMLDYLRSIDTMSRGNRSKVNYKKALIDRFIAQYCRVPSDLEMAEFLGMTEKEYHEQYDVKPGVSMISIDNPVVNQSNGENVAYVWDFDSGDYEKFMQKMYDDEEVESVIDELDKIEGRDREIMAMYFFDDRTMSEISQAFGITESRVSQIIKSCVRQIKKGYKQNME